MSRRSVSSAAEADRRFPVRIKIAIPSTGLGTLLVEMEMWLDRELGREGHGKSPATAIGTDATAYHFQDLDDAHRFLAAFPTLRLASPATVPARRTDSYS